MRKKLTSQPPYFLWVCVLFLFVTGCRETLSLKQQDSNKLACNVISKLTLKTESTNFTASVIATHSKNQGNILISGPLGITIAEIQTVNDSIFFNQGNTIFHWYKYDVCIIPELEINFSFTFDDFVRILSGEQSGLFLKDQSVKNTVNSEKTIQIDTVKTILSKKIHSIEYDWEGTFPWHLVFSQFREDVSYKTVLTFGKSNILCLEVEKRLCKQLQNN